MTEKLFKVHITQGNIKSWQKLCDPKVPGCAINSLRFLDIINHKLAQYLIEKQENNLSWGTTREEILDILGDKYKHYIFSVKEFVVDFNKISLLKDALGAGYATIAGLYNKNVDSGHIVVIAVDEIKELYLFDVSTQIYYTGERLLTYINNFKDSFNLFFQTPTKKRKVETDESVIGESKIQIRKVKLDHPKKKKKKFHLNGTVKFNKSKNNITKKLKDFSVNSSTDSV